jgi:lipopolysaccharide export system permease protein
MKGGTFYEIEGGKRVIFADKVDTQTHQASRVFIQTKHEGKLQVIHAQKAIQTTDPTTGKVVLVFRDGFLYDFLNSQKEARILRFKDSVMQVKQRDAILPKYKVKAAATGQLAHSERPEEIAELQWRFINPLSRVLLGLLAVPLSRSSPRESKYTKMPVAIAVFAVYSHLSAITKKWVAQGVIATLPGVWSVQMLLAALLLVVLLRPQRWLGRMNSRPRALCV